MITYIVALVDSIAVDDNDDDVGGIVVSVGVAVSVGVSVEVVAITEVVVEV